MRLVEDIVGTPALDNTRAITNDDNGLNEPLRRRATVPFGVDREAIANHLWLETDRRYREAVMALARLIGKPVLIDDADTRVDMSERGEILARRK